MSEQLQLRSTTRSFCLLVGHEPAHVTHQAKKGRGINRTITAHHIAQLRHSFTYIMVWHGLLNLKTKCILKFSSKFEMTVEFFVVIPNFRVSVFFYSAEQSVM
jgi:hypothetical protein